MDLKPKLDQQAFVFISPDLISVQTVHGSFQHPNKQEMTHRSSPCVIWWLPVLAGRDTAPHTSQRCSYWSCRPGIQVYTVEEQSSEVRDIITFSPSVEFYRSWVCFQKNDDMILVPLKWGDCVHQI